MSVILAYRDTDFVSTWRDIALVIDNVEDNIERNWALIGHFVDRVFAEKLRVPREAIRHIDLT